VLLCVRADVSLTLKKYRDVLRSYVNFSFRLYRKPLIRFPWNSERAPNIWLFSAILKCAVCKVDKWTEDSSLLGCYAVQRCVKYLISRIVIELDYVNQICVNFGMWNLCVLILLISICSHIDRWQSLVYIRTLINFFQVCDGMLFTFLWNSLFCIIVLLKCKFCLFHLIYVCCVFPNCR
jgi:hypothetical protein